MEEREEGISIHTRDPEEEEEETKQLTEEKVNGWKETAVKEHTSRGGPGRGGGDGKLPEKDGADALKETRSICSCLSLNVETTK